MMAHLIRAAFFERSYTEYSEILLSTKDAGKIWIYKLSLYSYIFCVFFIVVYVETLKLTIIWCLILTNKGI